MTPMIQDLWSDLQNPQIVWQVIAIGVVVTLSYVVTRWARRQARAMNGKNTLPDVAQRLSRVAGMADVAFPFLAWGILAWLVRLAKLSHVHANALRVAAVLLLAAGVVRLMSYAVGRILDDTGLLRMLRRVFALVVWFAVALHVTGMLSDVVDMLDSVDLLKVSGSAEPITLWQTCNAVFWVAVTLVAALWAGATIESRLMAAETIDQSLRVALGRFVRAALIVVAILVSMDVVGIPLTVLSVFGGALGVGLGLGLQRIASNYVSGFIILLDRSLRLGDLITVDKYHGAVSQIRTRYTVIKALDGTEAILPNELLVSSPVLNHSYTDRKGRAAVTVQVGFDTDIDRAIHIMQEVARAQPRVLADPPPLGLLMGFGADGLNLELGFWVPDPESGTGILKSDINRGILVAFRAEGIEIPFPQRDIRVRFPDGAIAAPSKPLARPNASEA